LFELLREAARRDPEQLAAIADDVPLTYADLAAKATGAAAALRERGIERLGIVDQDAAVVLPLLAASSLAGAEACVYPPLDRPEIAAATAERFGHDLIVSAAADLDLEAEVLDPEELFAAEPGPAGLPERRPLLILTTGTTGEPRGVRHDWSRLLRRTARVRPAPDERWLLAYGLHQFAGYQVVLQVAAAGATLVAPVPRRPQQGLDAIRRHAVTHASATPTFWRFLLAEMRAEGEEITSLRQITLGGEAIPAPLLGELERAFPNARVSQVYAGNEFGSTGSVRDGRNGLPASVLDRGEDADVAFKVVDGELWLRSRVGMLGYYGEEPLADPDDWRPTGDLVELEGDRIYFRGRATDVINVGGVKVHPLPIEERVSKVPGVLVCRVFGRPNALTGEIVAVEVVPAADAHADALKDAVRDACADLESASRPRSVKLVDEIATRGEKIERRARA
jgi:acyl-CoA synthetase (AMP-forming)/AMP-acid ligase II